MNDRKLYIINIILILVLISSTIYDAITPDIIEKTTVERIEIPVPIIQTTTEIIHVPVPMELNDFPSMKALEDFLLRDNTSQINYGDRFDCMDFALRLIEEAAKEYYRVLFFHDRLDERGAHALCMAYVLDEAKYVIFNPQTDKIEWTWASTRGG